MPMMTPQRAAPHELRIEHDDLGHAVRVYIGALDVTDLVARVQTNITMMGTLTEVVLCARTSHAVAAGARQ